MGIGKPYVGIKGELKVGDINLLPTGEIKKVWEDLKIEKDIKLNLD